MLATMILASRSLILRSKLLLGRPNLARTLTPVINNRGFTRTSAGTTDSIESPSKDDGSWFTRFRQKFGPNNADNPVESAATIQYQACTDKLSPPKYFEHFQLPDTLYSFYLVIQLHVWMCQARSLREGSAGRNLCNKLIERMWQDLDQRLSKIEAYSSDDRKAILNDLLLHHQEAMFSYDDGLLSDDKTLANAIWRTLFSKDTVDPRVLELAVKYVRAQMKHLNLINSRHWCSNGNFDWLPFPPLVGDNALLELKRPETSLSTDLRIPDENPEVEKKLVFQNFCKRQSSFPMYTVEEAAQYAPKEGFYVHWKYPSLAQQHKDMEYICRSLENEYTVLSHFPEVTDFCIVGGGLSGSACAYYIKRIASKCVDALVLDKDPYSTHNCTAICNGLISSQSKSQDISRVAYLSKELIRNLRYDVLCTPEDYAKIRYRPCTHLILWPEHEVPEVLESVVQQNEDGIFTEAKTPSELEESFSWLRAMETDIALGTHGNQDEALVDPIALRNLYRTLAQGHGANFACAEVIDFNTMFHQMAPEVTPNSACSVVVRLPRTGELRCLNYANIFLSLGHNMPYLEARAQLESYMRDSIEDLHFIQPKLRIHFIFQSLNAPVINFPVITDTDGSMLIKEDYSGVFKYYLSIDESENFFDLDHQCFMNADSDEPYPNLMHRTEMFEQYFDDVIKPKLARRIPSMDDAKFCLAYSGFESYNTHDGNPVIGMHPFLNHIHLCGGHGSRLMNFAPAAAISVSELMMTGEEETFDVTNFYWNRVIKGRRLQEFKTLVR